MTTPRFFYGQDPETERLELGPRAAYAYDEMHEIAYRFGAAVGIARPDVPMEWQRRLMAARRRGTVQRDLIFAGAAVGSRKDGDNEEEVRDVRR